MSHLPIGKCDIITTVFHERGKHYGRYDSLHDVQSRFQGQSPCANVLAQVQEKKRARFERKRREILGDGNTTQQNVK